MLSLEYVVTVPSELSAGLRGFTENVTVSFAHHDKAITDNDLITDLTNHFRQAIAEWFDVAPKCVATNEEYEKAFDWTRGEL